MRGIYQAFNTSRGFMIKNHSITELLHETKKKKSMENQLE
jgi:hypothetical protein